MQEPRAMLNYDGAFHRIMYCELLSFFIEKRRNRKGLLDENILDEIIHKGVELGNSILAATGQQNGLRGKQIKELKEILTKTFFRKGRPIEDFTYAIPTLFRFVEERVPAVIAHELSAIARIATTADLNPAKKINAIHKRLDTWGTQLFRTPEEQELALRFIDIYRDSRKTQWFMCVRMALRKHNAPTDSSGQPVATKRDEDPPPRRLPENGIQHQRWGSTGESNGSDSEDEWYDHEVFDETNAGITIGTTLIDAGVGTVFGGFGAIAGAIASCLAVIVVIATD